jgi:hypothetical protein
MFINFFMTAWRNIWRNKIFSFVNIISLSIGISISLVIYFIVSFDFSFDSGIRDSDRIYRVVSSSSRARVISYNGGITYPLSDGIRKDLSGIDLISPLFTWFPEKLTVPISGRERPVVFRQQKHIVFTDENYFRMIHYDWLAGSPVTSLSQPYQVVLTESNAKSYFPGVRMEDVIGRRLFFGDTLGTIITGTVYPEDDFNYSFQDEQIAKSYQSEQKIAGMLDWVTGIAIFISCLGLLGLIIYTTNQRSKEIGIRKIIGASVMQIIFLLSADFLKLISLAFLIAVPITWWGSGRWLDNFAYRTNLSVWIFIEGGLFMGGIAFIILLLRTRQSALANPANILRNE